MSTTFAETVDPPVVHIAPEVFYSDQGHKAYNEALDGSPVIVVPRSGRSEYIIDHKHAYDVLTDGKNFIFDQGVVRMLHMEFMMWFKNGTFVTELDGLVTTTIQSRLAAVLEQLEPLLQQGFAEQFGLNTTQKSMEVTDLFERIQNVIALAMSLMICGYDHVSPEMVKHFVSTTNATARLCGIYSHIDGWPMWLRPLYSYWSSFTSICTICWHLVWILPNLWKSRHQHFRNGLKQRSTEFIPIFDYILAIHWSDKQSGLVSFGNFLWCSIEVIAIVFASIHQTVVVAVWVMVELARRQDEYMQQIRTEWNATITKRDDGSPRFRTQDLNRMHHLDSFIREVMRTKGDAFAPVRYTTRPVRVGAYTVPANSICLPYVHRAHGHPDNYGTQGSIFNGFRWVNTNRPAVQGNESFLSFGVGRWACPGRHLAVAEIKILVYLLFERFEVELDEGSFEILDRMNTTSVPPKATLRLRRKEQ